MLLLLIALAGVLALTGTITYDPAMNAFPEEDHVGPNPDAYVGQQISVSGEAIATDPVVIRVEYGLDNYFDLTLTTFGTTVEEGQHVSAFGTLTDASTLEVERALVRWPWEVWYMYAISIIAAAWVAVRIYRHWRFNRDQFAFSPRGDPGA